MAHKYAIECDYCGEVAIYWKSDGAPSCWVELGITGLGSSYLDESGQFCSIEHATLWLQELGRGQDTSDDLLGD